jgi:hypothetical protein
VIESIGIIDDAKGEIEVEYMDGSTFSETIHINGENELKFFNPEQKDVKNFLVKFNGSGAVTGVTFAEFKEAPAPVPEPAGLLGLAIAGGLVPAPSANVSRRKASFNAAAAHCSYICLSSRHCIC